MKPVAICAFAALVGFSACSKPVVRDARAEAEARLCAKMARQSPAVRGYPDVGDETALIDVKIANTKTEQAVDDVAASDGEIENAQMTILQAAFQQLRDVTDSIPVGHMTVGPASGEIRLHAGHLRDAWDSLYSSLRCGA